MSHLSSRLVTVGLAVGALVLTGGGAVAGGMIGAAQIKDNAIRTQHIKNGQVASVDIQNGGVGLADLAPEIAGQLGSGLVAASDEASGSIDIGNSSSVINTVEISLPREGRFLVNGAGSFEVAPGSGSAFCGFSLYEADSEAAIDSSTPTLTTASVDSPINTAIVGTWLSPSVAPGDYRIEWACQRQAGDLGVAYLPTVTVLGLPG